jgi:DNA-binding XRE family transcriptional regulator
MDVTARSLPGAELRAHRERAGLTQSQIGQRLGFSVDTIKSVEGGRRNMSIDLAIACDKFFKTPGTPDGPTAADDEIRGTFVRAFEAARAQSYPDWFVPAIRFESQAARISEWEMRGVPGLLQVESYARAVIRAGHPSDSAEKVDRDVESRLQRQEILSRTDGPKLLSIVSEAVLHQRVGPVPVMYEQLDHLIRLVESDSPVVIQVLPFRVSAAPGVNGPITLYEFGNGKPQVAYLEGFEAARTVENPAEVAVIADTLDMIKGCASSPGDSLELIRQVRRGLDD